MPVEAAFESHILFADIHCIFQGEEVIYQNPVESLKQTSAYDEQDDYCLYSGSNEAFIKLRRGDFAVFFPNDGHKPGYHIEKTSLVRKVVMKIRLDN